MNAIRVGRVFGPTLFGLSLALLAAVSVAAPITQPAGLNPGDQYRLIFVTSGTIAGRTGAGGPADISGYNSFATSQATGQAELNSLGTTWNALVSYRVPSVSAVTNTGTTAGTGLPIYNLNGELVASSYTQLWSTGTNALTNPIRYTQAGTATSATFVWTGMTQTGAVDGDRGLGNPTGGYMNGGVPTSTNAYSGNSNQTAAWAACLYPFADPNSVSFSSFPIYVMSGALTAVPEPSSMALAGLGAVGAGLAVFRRRSRPAAV